MRIRALRAFLFWTVLLALVSSSAHAQGLGRDDRKAVASLEAFARFGVDWPLPPFVDLRDQLPAVGEQSMNDCAAWAFGYAARSQLEASIQGWKPEYPPYIFSPTFIYNQVNKGRDEGSNPVEVIQLLKGGAATLATAPYKPKDFLSAPPAHAFKEAPIFAMEGARFLSNGRAIRRALAAGYVVVVGVRTNPIFNKGLYSSYTSSLHEQAKLTRRPGQPHGYHAMVICGYNEQRRAFLFMNSWGKRWGQEGFVWVDYDVVDVFNNTSDITDNLMDFACILVSQGVPVIRETDGFRRADYSEITATVRGHFHSFDSSEQPRYAIETKLAGPYNLLLRVKSVRWSGVIDGQPWSQDGAKDLSLTFPARSLSGSPKLELTAAIAFADGSSRELSAKLDLPAVRPRYPEIRRVDQYVGKTYEGKQRWHAVYYPYLTEQDWQDLKTIGWRRGSQMISSTYTHDGGSEPELSRSVEYNELAARQPMQGATAIFTFRDGQSRTVPLPENPFTSLPTEEPVLISRTRLFGREGSHVWYQIDHEVWLPKDFLDSVEDVILSTGSAYSQNDYSMQRITERGLTRFVFTEFAAEPRQSHARVKWRRKTSYPELSNSTVVLEDITPSQRGFSLSHSDTYKGEENGKPVWKHEVGLQTLNIADTPVEVTWQVGSGTPVTWEDSRYTNHDLLTKRLEFTSGPEPVEVKATITLRNPAGEPAGTLTIRRTVEASSARNTALALLVREGVRDNWQGATPPNGLVEATLGGPAASVSRARSVHLLHRNTVGVRSILGSGDQGLLPPASAMDLRIPLANGNAVVNGWIQLNDDGVLAISSPVRPASPFLYAPPLQLEAVEHYEGLSNNKPSWRVALSLRGDPEVLAAIDRIDYKAEAIDGSSVAVQTEAANKHEARLTTSEPLRLRATVHFTAEVGTEPLELTSVVYTAAPRRKEVLELDTTPVWRAPHITQPGDTIAEMPDPETTRILRLVGPKRLLSSVAEVTYRWVPSEGGTPKVMRVTKKERDSLDGFPQRDTTPLGKSRYVAEVRLKDGTRLQLEKTLEETGEPSPTPTVTGIASYWGEEAGETLYLARWQIAPAQDVSRVVYEPSASVRPLDSTDGATYARSTFPYEALVSARTGAKLKAVRLTVPAFEGAATAQTLDVPPEPTWELALPTPNAEAQLKILPDPLGFPDVSFLRIEAPASLLARTERVVYQVSSGGKTRELTPFAQGCETGGLFDCRWLGPLPERVTATLYDREGKVLALHWRLGRPNE